MITRFQIVAARGLLGWSQGDLSDKSGVPIGTIKTLESGKTDNPQTKTIESIVQAFSQSTIEFIEGGVRKRDELSYILRGDNGIKTFYNEVATTAEELNSGEFLVYCVGQERLIARIQRHPVFHQYLDRMTKTKTRVLMLRGANDVVYHPSNFLSVKYMPSDHHQTSMISFIYGDRVALFRYDDALEILVIHHEAFVNLFRQQFYDQWNTALNSAGDT